MRDTENGKFNIRIFVNIQDAPIKIIQERYMKNIVEQFVQLTKPKGQYDRLLKSYGYYYRSTGVVDVISEILPNDN